FEAAADGAIKALWIACTNPAQSMPDQAMVRRALERCEFIVLQEAFSTTATAPYADLLLPATTWGEKDGTVTNSERRISRVRAAVPAPGQARDDWAIAVDFARRLEQRLPARRADGATLFPYADAESVWNEHRQSTRGRDLDITGLSYPALEAQPQQWPCPEGATSGQARLYEDGRFATPDGRARFVAPAYRPVAEPRDARFPFSLTTGRLRDQWHGMSRSGTLGRLFGQAPQPSVDVHPQEMARRGWSEGALVHVTSRRGSILLPLRASDEVAPSQAFVAMHWGEEFASGRAAAGALLAGVNALMPSAHCPQSKQPELKHAAVKLLKAELPWHLVAAAWLPQGEALVAQQQLRALMPAFDYAHCVPFGREGSDIVSADAPARVGVLLRAAAQQPASNELMTQIERVLGIAGAQVLRYADARRGQRRAMRLHAAAELDAATLDAFLLAGDAGAATWVLGLLQDGQPARPFGQALLNGRASPPAAVKPRAPQVCNCFDVSQSAIVDALAACHGSAEARLAQLQQRLSCGTQCGSCLPAVRALVAEHQPRLEVA
ncbi:MAG: molybdopterin-dependent oxidoreductase, partial [Pseudomonadota bacterium]